MLMCADGLFCSLATVFKQFDKNGDGQLGADEIAAMMKVYRVITLLCVVLICACLLQHIGAGVDQKEFFAKLDEDGSGAISPVCATPCPPQ